MNEVTTEALELVHKLENELEGHGETAQPEAPKPEAPVEASNP